MIQAPTFTDVTSCLDLQREFLSFRDPTDPYATRFSVESTVNEDLFYGRVWQSATGAAPGQFAEEAGTRGYANLIASVPGCVAQHDEVAVATYCHTGAGGQWWTFDDTWSIGKKTAWIKSRELLGAMFWEMSGDTGTLINAVDTGLR